MHDPLVIPRPAAPTRWRLVSEPRLTEAEFLSLCRANPDLRLERTAEGAIIVMPPTGGDTGERNSEINYQLRRWLKHHRSGKVYDSSTAFRLPNGATRSPDAAWVGPERLATLTAEDLEGFPPVCPDFVVELRSATDRLRDLQVKMREYVDNGARLGWLIDPVARTAFVYRPGRPVERCVRPPVLRGEPELPGLALDLMEVWGRGSG